MNEDWDKQLSWLKWAVPVCFFLFIYFHWFYALFKARNYSFSGLVEKVDYSYPQHVPTITVRGETYDLFYCTWDSGRKREIEQGDSVIKKEGVTDFILIKNKK